LLFVGFLAPVERLVVVTEASALYGQRGVVLAGLEAAAEVWALALAAIAWEYFRVGLPITVMTLIVGWAWLEWVK